MKETLLKLERSARIIMGATAIVMLLITVCFKAGWVSRTQQYKPDAWYVVDDRGIAVITRQHATEDDCRADSTSSHSICRSGSALIAEAANKTEITQPVFP